jgi:hypothetical protein
MGRGRAVVAARWAALAWSLAALLLTACASDPARPPASSTPAPASPPAGATIDRADLALARSLWAPLAGGAYMLTIEATDQGVAAVATVEVVGGRVRSASLADGGRPPEPLAALTVERLFEMVENGLAGVEAGRIHHLEVMFDGHHGLPIDVRITERAGGPGRRYVVRQYAPLTP